MDGFAFGKLGLAGIGGIFRDSSGKTLFTFFKSIGEADSNVAEYLVVKEPFALFGRLDLRNAFHLIIEIDSANAYKWVLSLDGKVPWRLHQISFTIEALKMYIPH